MKLIQNLKNKINKISDLYFKKEIKEKIILMSFILFLIENTDYLLITQRVNPNNILSMFHNEERIKKGYSFLTNLKLIVNQLR